MYLSILRGNTKFMMVICAVIASKCLKPKDTFRDTIKTVKLDFFSLDTMKYSSALIFILDMEDAVNSKMYRDDSLMWTCAECHYQSRTKGHVFEHIEGKHNVHDGYFCQSCEKVYKSRASYRMHNKRCQIIT